MKNKGFYQLEKSLDSLFADALENGVFSGASTALLYQDRGRKKRLIKSYGRTRYDEAGKKITGETFFDLASLTKPLCTVLSILSLIEENKITWASALKSSIRDQTSPFLKNCTIKDLLSHSSGLTDYRPFYKDFEPVPAVQTKNRIIEKILQEPLVYPPGEKCLYSDLGYILLGEIIERLTGTGLETYFAEKISGPLDLEKYLFFRPHGTPNEVNIAATEICPWRKKLLQGEVHDEHCWLMGGVAGHAGLFGTASGVLGLAEHILNQWRGRSRHPSYGNTLLQQALEARFRGGTWSLGFDRPSPEGSSAGKYMSKNSAGHLGYTGTSFWIDPVRELIVILLTNRVHPTRSNKKIMAFRPLFHNTVIESLEGR